MAARAQLGFVVLLLIGVSACSDDASASEDAGSAQAPPGAGTRADAAAVPSGGTGTGGSTTGSGGGGGTTGQTGWRCDPDVQECLPDGSPVPICELVEGDTDPCRLCAIGRCCGRNRAPEIPWTLELADHCFFERGGGECLAEMLPRMQECYANKLATGSTAPSIDIIGECLCRPPGFDIDPALECRSPLDEHNHPGYDSPYDNFIACLVWPDPPGDTGDDAGSADAPGCAAECFPPWR